MSQKVKVYTRTGDKGETSLYGGKRVEKHNLQVVAYGTVDEVNSALGVIIAHLEKKSTIHTFLTTVQGDLFTIGSHLSGSNQDVESIGARIAEMEKFIDSLDKDLLPLKNFILPGGTKEASFAHIARSVCRRAEREVIRLSKEEKSVVDKRVIMYLNRFSDVLFVIARFLNRKSGLPDVVWKGK